MLSGDRLPGQLAYPPRVCSLAPYHQPENSHRPFKRSSTDAHDKHAERGLECTRNSIKVQAASPHELRSLVGEETGLRALSLHLHLPGKRVQTLKHVGAFRHLRVLNASGNAIRNVDDLASTPLLKELLLSRNRISDLSKITLLTNLETLDISYNQVQDFPQKFQSLHLLACLDASHNKISEVAAFQTLSPLRKLVKLATRGNPIAEQDYRYTRLFILVCIPQLDILDGDSCHLDEKEQAKQKFVERKAMQEPVTPSQATQISTEHHRANSSGIKNHEARAPNGDHSTLQQRVQQLEWHIQYQREHYQRIFDQWRSAEEEAVCLAEELAVMQLERDIRALAARAPQDSPAQDQRDLRNKLPHSRTKIQSDQSNLYKCNDVQGAKTRDVVERHSRERHLANLKFIDNDAGHQQSTRAETRRMRISDAHASTSSAISRGESHDESCDRSGVPPPQRDNYGSGIAIRTNPDAFQDELQEGSTNLFMSSNSVHTSDSDHFRHRERSAIGDSAVPVSSGASAAEGSLAQRAASVHTRNTNLLHHTYEILMRSLSDSEDDDCNRKTCRKWKRKSSAKDVVVYDVDLAQHQGQRTKSTRPGVKERARKKHRGCDTPSEVPRTGKRIRSKVQNITNQLVYDELNERSDFATSCALSNARLCALLPSASCSRANTLRTWKVSAARSPVPLCGLAFESAREHDASFRTTDYPLAQFISSFLDALNSPSVRSLRALGSSSLAHLTRVWITSTNDHAMIVGAHLRAAPRAGRADAGACTSRLDSADPHIFPIANKTYITKGGTEPYSGKRKCYASFQNPETSFDNDAARVDARRQGNTTQHVHAGAVLWIRAENHDFLAYNVDTTAMIHTAKHSPRTHMDNQADKQLVVRSWVQENGRNEFLNSAPHLVARKPPHSSPRGAGALDRALVHLAEGIALERAEAKHDPLLKLLPSSSSQRNSWPETEDKCSNAEQRNDLRQRHGAVVLCSASRDTFPALLISLTDPPAFHSNGSQDLRSKRSQINIAVDIETKGATDDMGPAKAANQVTPANGSPLTHNLQPQRLPQQSLLLPLKERSRNPLVPQDASSQDALSCHVVLESITDRSSGDKEADPSASETEQPNTAVLHRYAKARNLRSTTAPIFVMQKFLPAHDFSVQLDQSSSPLRSVLEVDLELPNPSTASWNLNHSKRRYSAPFRFESIGQARRGRQENEPALQCTQVTATLRGSIGEKLFHGEASRSAAPEESLISPAAFRRMLRCENPSDSREGRRTLPLPLRTHARYQTEPADAVPLLYSSRAVNDAKGDFPSCGDGPSTKEVGRSSHGRRWPDNADLKSLAELSQSPQFGAPSTMIPITPYDTYQSNTNGISRVDAVDGAETRASRIYRESGSPHRGTEERSLAPRNEQTWSYRPKYHVHSTSQIIRKDSHQRNPENEQCSSRPSLGDNHAVGPAAPRPTFLFRRGHEKRGAFAPSSSSSDAKDSTQILFRGRRLHLRARSSAERAYQRQRDKFQRTDKHRSSIHAMLSHYDAKTEMKQSTPEKYALPRQQRAYRFRCSESTQSRCLSRTESHRSENTTTTEFLRSDSLQKGAASAKHQAIQTDSVHQKSMGIQVQQIEKSHDVNEESWAIQYLIRRLEAKDEVMRAREKDLEREIQDREREIRKLRQSLAVAHQLRREQKVVETEGQLERILRALCTAAETNAAKLDELRSLRHDVLLLARAQKR